MKELIDKMNMELLDIRGNAALSPITADTLAILSYRIAVMQFCIEAVQYLIDDTSALTDSLVSWLMDKDNTLGYLYQLWLDCDYSFIPPLADVLLCEIKHDMGVMP